MPGPLNEALFASLGLEDLVPPSLAVWRPLVFDGVRFFLQRLSPERRAELVLDQFALPGDATAAERLVVVLGRCPTLHKLGQVIARHRGLNADLRARLQTLESLPPSTEIEPLLAHVRAQLPADARVELDNEALAEGSVAVVVPFTFEEDGARKHGVFKVLKPGAAERMHEELAIWLELGQFLEERARALSLPALEFHDTLDSVRVLLANEVTLEVEQANLAAAAPFYRHDARIMIPRLLPWCTQEMTAMERVFGVPVTAAPLDAAARRHLAATLTSGLLAQPFWTKDAWAVIHADPHAGNLFATDDGRLAVLDW
ncbi:MAG TPA: AarF/UbiB family protein, partial [Burkholderiaceae bacterium]|nr:AarF/UbiB family protein [Burkholderiaceae bacterium]